MPKTDLAGISTDEQIQLMAEYTHHCAEAGTSPNYHKRFKYSDIPPGVSDEMRQEKDRRLRKLREHMRHLMMLEYIRMGDASDPGHCQDQEW